MIKNFEKMPILKTKRLMLRRLQDGDLDLYFTSKTHPQIVKYLNSPVPRTKEEVKKYIEKTNNQIDKKKAVSFTAIREEDNKQIGNISIWNFNEDGSEAELGYSLLPNYWGRGYMREMLNSICIYGFEDLSLKTIFAYTHNENENSKKCLVKAGFKFKYNVFDPSVDGNSKVLMSVYSINR